MDIVFDGQQLTLALTDIFGLEGQIFSRRRGSLADHEDDIRRALEKLFSGF